MRADQVGVVDVGVIQIAVGLHLRLHRLHHLALAQQLVVDLDAGDLEERLGERLRFVFVRRDGFRQDVDFQALERLGGIDEPFHFLHLLRLGQRRRLELLVDPLLCFVRPRVRDRRERDGHRHCKRPCGHSDSGHAPLLCRTSGGC